jgi:hypothetical protein
MTENNDAFKAAEQRGYSRGYRAGRLRKRRDIDREQQAARREAFIERTFLQILPWALDNRAGWGRKIDGKHVPFTKEERIDFAWKTAVEAWDHRKVY